MTVSHYGTRAIISSFVLDYSLVLHLLRVPFLVFWLSPSSLWVVPVVLRDGLGFLYVLPLITHSADRGRRSWKGLLRSRSVSWHLQVCRSSFYVVSTHACSSYDGFPLDRKVFDFGREGVCHCKEKYAMHMFSLQVHVSCSDVEYDNSSVGEEEHFEMRHLIEATTDWQVRHFISLSHASQ